MSGQKEGSIFLRLLEELEAAYEIGDEKKVQKIITFSQVHTDSVEAAKRSREVQKEEHHK
jgi:hypothetical protein